MFEDDLHLKNVVASRLGKVASVLIYRLHEKVARRRHDSPAGITHKNYSTSTHTHVGYFFVRPVQSGAKQNRQFGRDASTPFCRMPLYIRSYEAQHRCHSQSLQHVNISQTLEKENLKLGSGPHIVRIQFGEVLKSREFRCSWFAPVKEESKASKGEENGFFEGMLCLQLVRVGCNKFWSPCGMRVRTCGCVCEESYLRRIHFLRYAVLRLQQST